MAEIKVRTEGSYLNHNVKANKSIDVVLKAPYSELTNYIQTIQMLNENVEVGAKIGSDKPIKLGTFMISSISVDRDGEGKIKLNSQLDYVDSNSINELANRNDEPLKIMFKAQIEEEETVEAE